MKQREPVSKIMTENLVKLNIQDSLTKAESLFKKHKIRHIPVVKNEKVVGMLSYTDLMRISFADATNDDGEAVETTVYDMFSLEQVMTNNVEVIAHDANIKDAAEVFTKKEFHALPVVKEDSLVGIVTTTDMIKYLVEQY
ncbi:CBS domain-containing protein [Psychroflexus salarius]|uniref:CBS domain-containing protein n=1 Tax=Psychroflexus salarius TaxID=1155689 RepID=A0A1M4UPW5_9FLAO|nr:CBS domain-containing protein [Psychroflexus salarius]SHE58802.1 CBS domain-containing protein [Psychroflexus salarius]